MGTGPYWKEGTKVADEKDKRWIMLVIYLLNIKGCGMGTGVLRVAFFLHQ